MLTRRWDLRHVGPALAVEYLSLRYQLAVRLAADHHDLVAHHRSGRRGTRVVQRGQRLPRALTQRVDALRLLRGQLLAGTKPPITTASPL